MAPYHNEIVLNRLTIVQALGSITVLLLVASVTGQFARHELGYDEAYGIIHLFNVDAEGNIPTFFSSFLLLSASLLLALITTLKRKSHDPRWHQWAILSCALLYMAMDEASHIHELLYRPADWLLGHRYSRIIGPTWVIFGIAFAVAFSLSYLKFFFSLPSRTQRQFFFAAATFLGGAAGMELVGGFYSGRYGMHNLQYAMLATVEEGLEMTGVILLIDALLNYTIHNYDVRLSFRHAQETLPTTLPTTQPGKAPQLKKSYRFR